jgi:hypothetical protein
LLVETFKIYLFYSWRGERKSNNKKICTVFIVKKSLLVLWSEIILQNA